MRNAFIVFASNLINDGWDKESWEKYAVTHYGDEELESIRNTLVAACINDRKFRNEGGLSENTENVIKQLLSRLSNAAI